MAPELDECLCWDELLNYWETKSWVLQRLISNPHRKLPFKQDPFLGNLYPDKIRCPPINWTEEQFKKFVGGHHYIYFEKDVVDKFRKDNPDLLQCAVKDSDEWDLEHDWSKYYTWSDLVVRWGFQDEWSLFSRFYESSNRLVACWWNPDIERFDRRMTEIDVASRTLPDLSDLLFCKKHIEIYERRCYTEFPNNVYLSEQYELADYSLDVGDKTPDGETSALQPGDGIKTAPKTGDEFALSLENLKGKRDLKYGDRQAHYWRCRAMFRFLKAENESKDIGTISEYANPIVELNKAAFIEVACENKKYDSDLIKRWVTGKCRIPTEFETGLRPWQDAGDERHGRDQMRRLVRCKECVLAIAQLIWFTKRNLKAEAVIELCLKKNIGAFQAYAIEPDLDEVNKIEEKRIEGWLQEIAQRPDL